MQKIFDLKGKVAIVTGGNGGIGKGIARGFAAAGADIVIAARNPSKTEKAAAEIKESFDVRVLEIQLDIRQEDEIQKMAAQSVDSFGRIDILVNNAGINIRKMPQDYLSSEWDEVIEVNLRSPFLCCQAVHPAMKSAGGGKIINIGSIAGLVGLERSVIYATAKAGMHEYTRCLAVQLKTFNINVNAIAPGDIITERWKASRTYEEEKMVTGGTLDRYGQPEEISRVVEFLASEQASFISGQILRVDGCAQAWPA